MLRKKVAARQVTVVFEPDGAGWHVFIPEVRGCRSHGRSIGEARKNIREALSLCDDEFPNAARLAKTVEFIEEVQVPKAARRARSAFVARQDGVGPSVHLRGQTDLCRHTSVCVS
jgi:hypothetical protein